MHRRQRRSIVSVAEYETDRESLRRMLADFQDDYLAKHKAGLQDSSRTMCGFRCTYVRTHKCVCRNCMTLAQLLCPFSGVHMF